ncbi:MAG: hypothetical protein IPP51_11625 [Bacteroidetes bacterium]|nr:hypothetical protein [Bacteroidota bacterium]
MSFEVSAPMAATSSVTGTAAEVSIAAPNEWSLPEPALLQAWRPKKSADECENSYFLHNFSFFEQTKLLTIIRFLLKDLKSNVPIFGPKRVF